MKTNINNKKEKEEKRSQKMPSKKDSDKRRSAPHRNADMVTDPVKRILSFIRFYFYWNLFPRTVAFNQGLVNFCHPEWESFQNKINYCANT